jgi:hypothetical protein
MRLVDTAHLQHKHAKNVSRQLSSHKPAFLPDTDGRLATLQRRGLLRSSEPSRHRAERNP